MTDTSTALAELQPAPHLEALTAKQQRFVEAFVWQAKPVVEAARAAGLDRSSGFRLMHTPSVVAAIDLETRALRASKRPAAIERLAQLSAQNDSLNASFQASRWLASSDADGQNVQVNVGVSIGYVIDLSEPSNEC